MVVGPSVPYILQQNSDGDNLQKGQCYVGMELYTLHSGGRKAHLVAYDSIDIVVVGIVANVGQ